MICNLWTLCFSTEDGLARAHSFSSDIALLHYSGSPILDSPVVN